MWGPRQECDGTDPTPTKPAQLESPGRLTEVTGGEHTAAGPGVNAAEGRTRLGGQPLDSPGLPNAHSAVTSHRPRLREGK